MGADFGQHLIPTSDAAIDLGATSTRFRTAYARELRAVGTPGSTTGIINEYAQSNTDRALLQFWKARDSAGALAVVVSGDSNGEINFNGYDGSAYSQGAWIRSVSDGTIAAGRMPSRIEFGTAPDAVGSPTARWRMMPTGYLIPASDSNYDIGLSGTRVANIWSDQWNAVAPNIGVNVGTGSAVTLGSKAVDGITAGDVLRFDAWVLFLNNTAATKTYSLYVDIGSTFALIMSTNNLAQNATNKLPVHLTGIISVVSTSSCFTAQRIEHAATSSASSSDVSATTTTFDQSAWASAATNLTGTQTVSLFAVGASGATQTADMLSFLIERFRP